MENFRNILKKRLVLSGVYNVMVIIFLVIGYVLGRKNEAPELAVGYASGFFVGIQFVMIYYICKYSAALKSDKKLKVLYIAENDERDNFIKSKIGGIGVNVILGGMALGTIITVFLNETVFFTLLFVLIFSLLVKGALKLYYRKRF